MRKASRQVGLARLRLDLLSLLRMSELGRAPTFSIEGQSLAQLYQVPGALERVLAAPALRKELYEKGAHGGQGCPQRARARRRSSP